VWRCRARPVRRARAADRPSRQREVASFLDLDRNVAIADRGAGLRGLHFDALEDAEAVELALRLQHGRVAERLTRLEAGAAQHDVAIGVRIAAHRDLVDVDVRPFGDRVDDLRLRLVGAHGDARRDLHFDVAAVRVIRLQRDDVVVQQLRIERLAGASCCDGRILQRDLLVAFDGHVGEQRLRSFGDRELHAERAVFARRHARLADGCFGEAGEAVERFDGVAIVAELAARDTGGAAQQRLQDAPEAAARRRGDDAVQLLFLDLFVADEVDVGEPVLFPRIHIERHRQDVVQLLGLEIDGRQVMPAQLQSFDDVVGGAIDGVFAVLLIAPERQPAPHRVARHAFHRDLHDGADLHAIAELHCVRGLVVFLADEVDVGATVVAAHQEVLHPVRVFARFEQVERLAGTPLHARDELRLVNGAVFPSMSHLTDFGLRSRA
jgi:hypothetical protein